MLQMNRFAEIHNLLIITCLCVCVHLYSLSMYAQDHQTLRSQLKEATEVLACYPDSVDLRLKKAALNLQLEQWKYAKDEYDQVLRSHPDNIAGCIIVLMPTNSWEDIILHGWIMKIF